MLLIICGVCIDGICLISESTNTMFCSRKGRNKIVLNLPQAISSLTECSSSYYPTVVKLDGTPKLPLRTLGHKAALNNCSLEVMFAITCFLFRSDTDLTVGRGGADDVPGISTSHPSALPLSAMITKAVLKSLSILEMPRAGGGGGGVGWLLLQYRSELSVVSVNCQLITVSVF